ncbi:hypothetical protein ABMA27_011360, partial [Loxostege sticticalis]
SLGVVLYVLVCGALPFDGGTLHELRSVVLSGKFRIPYFMSQECEHLIRHMLVVDADKRLSLRNVARHRWLAQHTPHANPELDASIGQCSCHAGMETGHSASMHDTVVAHMLNVPSLTQEHVYQSVREERFDHIYAIYHLLMDKLQQRTSARNSLQHRDSLDSTTGQPLDLTSCKNPEDEQMDAEESTQECLVSIPCVNVDYLTERADSLEKFGDGSTPVAEETSTQQQTTEPHATRRHTVGPGDCRHAQQCCPQGGELGVCGAASADLRPGPLYVSAHFNQQAPANVSLLPNTNLCGKLPAVQHQPPRYFSVKDQHLLKPPHAMQTHASSFGRRASDGGAHVPRGRERACCHSAPAHHASDSGTPPRAEDSEQTDEHSADAAYNNNLCRYMLTRGSGKRHTIASQDDAGVASNACSTNSMPSTSPSSTSSIRVRRTGLLTVTERPPVISPELVMEVEARMNRNYLPPSIQSGYQYQGYQNPPTPPSTQNVPQSPTQGSITQGTPSYPNPGPSQKKSVLETIPQGSMIGTKGSIMSGTPITSQAVSPFTPQLNQYSPTHGTVVQSGSITSGTPVQNQGSIVSGTPISNSFDTKNFGNFGNNYSAPNFNTMSGTNFNTNNNFGTNVPMSTNSNFGTNSSSNNNFGQNMSSNPNYGTNTSNPNFSTSMNTNTSFGTSMNTNTSYNTNVSSNPNFASNFGSITSGTPMNYQNQVSTAQMQNMPSGSIMAGTPCQNSVSGTGQYSNQGQYNTRQRKYSGPTRVKLQTLATVQEMAREHAERYSPVRRAECSPPRAQHDLASAKLEYQQLQRGLERRSGGGGAGASPPLADTRLHTPATSMPGSPVAACGVAALDLSLVSPEAARAVLCAARTLRDPAAMDLPRTKLLTQELALKLGINLHTLCSPHVNASQEILTRVHSYSNYSLLAGHAPASPPSPLRQITEGLSYLHTGSITRGTPQASATPLDLRSNVEMDTSQYPQLHPMVHPQIHMVTHRSLNNSPISNPGSPLDMIQEEIGNGSHNGDSKLFSQEMTRNLHQQFQNYVSTHPQISLTDCLGSEITLVASSSEDSMDSLENTKYSLPQFVISEPSDLDDRPSITKGIGRKVSQETEPPPPIEVPKVVEKDAEMESPKETVEDTSKFLCEDLKYIRRGSDKSLGFSDDSLSNDSANVSPNCEQNVQSIYSNIVSISSGFSENRGSFSEHRESFSFSDRGSFSERGDFGRSSFSERSDFGRGSFSEKGETPRSSFSAQGTLGEVKEFHEDVYMPRDTSRHCLEKCDEESPQGTEEIEKLQRSTMDLRLTEICRPEEQKIPILLSPQKVSCVQEYYEVTLSTVCSKLDSQSIVELLRDAINTRVPPQNIFVETNGQNDSEDEALTGFLNLEYSGGIQIELVVCENKAKEKKGLKMRRISGDQREYGKLCQQLITSLTV